MSTVTLRFDDQTKKSLDELCENLGLTISSFFNIYAKRAIQDQAIPFSLTSRKSDIGEICKNDLKKAHTMAIRNGTADMSLDEINKEIYG